MSIQNDQSESGIQDHIDITEDSPKSLRNTPNDNYNSHEIATGMEINMKSDEAKSCSSCQTEKQSKKFIYAIGRIKPRFPDLSIENEYRQLLMLKSNTSKKTESQVFYEVLQEYDYLARELCWTFSIENIDTYIILPKNSSDFAKLVESINPNNEDSKELIDRGGHIDRDILIGELGPIAPPTLCNGLTLPIVFFDQIYSFSTEKLIKAIPKSKDVEEKSFRNTAQELFDRIQQIADNLGATDEHRALNYLAVRYSKIYDLATEMYAQDCSLNSITVVPSRLIGTRKILDPVFEYVNRKTDVRDKYFVRVDVTGKYPFLHTKLTRFFDRV